MNLELNNFEENVFSVLYRVTKMAMKMLSLLFFFPVAIMKPLHIMICLEEIISKQFLLGEIVVFSLPPTIPDEYMLIIDAAISNISSKEKWPLIISTDTQSTDAYIPEPQHGYVIFLLPDEDILTSLEVQIQNLQTFSFSYNRRGKFIIVVLLLVEVFVDSHILSNEILNTVWNKDNIVNAVVIIPSMVKYDATMNEDREVYDIYTLFPFRSEHCGEFNNSDLLDQWSFSEGFLTGNELMPEKLPNDLLGCFLHIYNTPPFVFVSNYTDTQGNVVYDIKGINTIFLNFLSEAMNFSIKYDIEKGWNSVFERLSESRFIAVGAYLMFPHSYAFADISTPYLYGDFLLYVPCAKKNPSSGNVLKVFSTVVWLLSISVILLVSVLFFILQRNDSTKLCYNTLPSCFLNAWAVFLSASVPSMPTGSMFRIVFFLFVCFSFVLNTVFQSFFTSYFIDPGHEKQIGSIEDLNEMGITFLFSDLINYVEQLSGVKFVSNFKYTKYCEPYSECCKAMLKFQNCSIIENHFKVEYYASYVRVKGLCTAWRYEKIGMVFLMSRGHSILAKFNYFIKKCIENGIFDHYWSIILWIHRVAHIYGENEDYYNTFGIDHLQICFSFLGIGYILSIYTFCLE
ncbi:Ionotropic receptor 703 [Blattella germanica]|nr:Ionotropic receptor 703 [Blattella germanica]